MSVLSRLRAMSSALVAGAKACVGIPRVLLEPDAVLPADALAYEQEFFEPSPTMRTVGWPAEVEEMCEPRGLRSDRWLPTIDNAKHEYSTTASRREAQRKLDDKRMIHVSVPVSMQDRFAVSVVGERAWNKRIRPKGTTYHRSVVL